MFWDRFLKYFSSWLSSTVQITYGLSSRAVIPGARSHCSRLVFGTCFAHSEISLLGRCGVGLATVLPFHKAIQVSSRIFQI